LKKSMRWGRVFVADGKGGRQPTIRMASRFFASFLGQGSLGVPASELFGGVLAGSSCYGRW
jgi:hypothetical protein